MPPRHLFAIDREAQRLFVLKADLADLTHQAQAHAERIGVVEASVTDLGERVTALEAAAGGVPWSAAGTGSATVFDLVGAASIAPADWLVTVAGIDQHGAFGLAAIAGGARLTFSEAPPAGALVVARHLTQHARIP